MDVTYPLDLTGINPTNLVKSELHTVNEAHFKDYYFIVPNFAPFYVDNFKIKLVINGVATELEEDVGFSFALPYIAGTREAGKNMYGGITLHNVDTTGMIVIDYQTVGGDQIVDKMQVLTVLADKAYNPRTTVWDALTNLPTAFPPKPHYQDYDTFFGQNEVVAALIGIRDAILQNSSITGDQLQAFLETMNSGIMEGYVKKTGDTVLGPLLLSTVPSLPMEAVTKDYVDTTFAQQETVNQLLGEFMTSETTNNLLSGKLSLTGGTMTGPIELSGEPVKDSEAVTKRYVDQIKSNVESQLSSMTQTINAFSQTQIDKAYVDNKFNEVMAYFQSAIVGK